MSGGDYSGLARLRDDMGLPWGVVSEDGRIIEDHELACSRATHANIVVVSPDTVQAALTSGRVVDHSAASAKGVVNHKKTLSRGTCVLCGQYAVLGELRGLTRPQYAVPGGPTRGARRLCLHRPTLSAGLESRGLCFLWRDRGHL